YHVSCVPSSRPRRITSDCCIPAIASRRLAALAHGLYRIKLCSVAKVREIPLCFTWQKNGIYPTLCTIFYKRIVGERIAKIRKRKKNSANKSLVSREKQMCFERIVVKL
ncbi:MAG: hypothetical protein IJL59_10490, partial [Clostridia bacterium]|nr:hypothetical protein [Clostridia bacterium]